VDFVGKEVRRGAPLAAVFSQEVYAAKLELVALLEQSKLAAPARGSFAEAEQTARHSLLEAGRRRLRLWDVGGAEIRRIEKTGVASRTFTLSAPRSGTVLSKQAYPGIYVDPSLELYVISDLKKLWVRADVYESDVPYVKLGQAAKLELSGAAGPPRTAQVTFIPPTIDEATRTLEVRLDLDNRDRSVRPGSFATVEIELDLGESLAVPEDSVIHAGPRDIVFVVHGRHIQPREVRLGPLVGSFYKVEAGVESGERVAVGAQFLLDSESRLRATSGAGPGHAGH
jgi:Cu(I)/Ag(I) efflux system membrane fusion protein